MFISVAPGSFNSSATEREVIIVNLLCSFSFLPFLRLVNSTLEVAGGVVLIVLSPRSSKSSATEREVIIINLPCSFYFLNSLLLVVCSLALSRVVIRVFLSPRNFVRCYREGDQHYQLTMFSILPPLPAPS